MFALLCGFNLAGGLPQQARRPLTLSSCGSPVLILRRPCAQKHDTQGTVPGPWRAAAAPTAGPGVLDRVKPLRQHPLHMDIGRPVRGARWPVPHDLVVLTVVALPITVVVIRNVVYLVTPNVVSFCASSILTATSSSRGAISTGVKEPERERDIEWRVVA